MGTTSIGLRYPEPTDPVSQGAAAMGTLAGDVNARYPLFYYGPPSAQNLPANGTLGFVSPITVPAVPYTRRICVNWRGLCTVLATNGSGDLVLLLNSAAVARARCVGPGNPHGYYSAVVGAGVQSVWSVNVTSNLASTWVADNFGGMDISAFPIA